ncbi:MAG: bacteriohemerythrin [Spirochaetales bacterium]|jgi:hemerythrin|nr:bacteriohemerythrin [Spirochaetales bacterium]
MLEKSPFVYWDDSFSVGVPLIDEQHKELVRMTNVLFEGCERGGTGLVSFMQTIQSATNYAKIHFATEEKYMVLVSYPDYEPHKREHESFVAEVLRQVRLFEQNKTQPMDFALFLKNWLLNHIAVSDKKFSPFFIPIADQIVVAG